MRVLALCVPVALFLGACGSSDDGGGDGGGMGGMGGGPPPMGCKNLGVATTADAETKLIVPTCGKGPSGQICHAGTFPPRLDMAGMIKAALVDKKGVTACSNDYYVNSKDPTKSYVINKLNAMGGDPLTNAKCPSGGVGGGQMPYKGYTPPAPDLTTDQKTCILWYVSAIAVAK